MATEDLIPTYLQEIFNRAIPNQLTGNEPLQAFTAPLDSVSLTETVTATVAAAAPAEYSVSRYGLALYGARGTLETSATLETTTTLETQP